MERIFFSMLVIILFSCQPSDSESYYNFKKSDYEFIPEQYKEIGKEIKFKNAQNEEVRIKPLYYTQKKEFESGHGFGQPKSESYNYDDLWIEIDLLDMEVTNAPEGYCKRIYIHINKAPYKGLSVDLQIPAYINTFCNGGGFQEFSPFTGLTQMVINNETYSKVKIVTPNDFFTMYDGSHIDKVYYDMDKGIIGFDDTQNNKKFRLVTE